MTHHNQTIAAAVVAHERGWTPTPIHPGLKRPLLDGWPSLTYASPEAVTSTFERAAAPFEDHPLNLGLALGAGHGGLVDIDLDHPKTLGLASRLLPNTPMRSGRAGRPGSHYWYAVDGYDPGICKYTLPSGATIIEFRAGGGQTVIPPSIHPDGEPYEWAGDPWGGQAGPTRLDATEGKRLHAVVMSMALGVVLADVWPGRGGRHGAYLALVGGLLRDEADGAPALHPVWDFNVSSLITILVGLTNDSDGPRARIGESVDTTRKRILRGDKVQGWPTLAGIIGDEHVTKARTIIEAIETLTDRPRARRTRAAEREWWSDGPALTLVTPDRPNESAEDKTVRLAQLDPSERDPLRERDNDWEAVDMEPYVKGGVKAPTPGLLHRDDGIGLIYPGRVNSFYGEGGSGKTLLALLTAERVIASGETVLFIDMEDEPHGTLTRLRDLGVPDEAVLDRFTYLRPEYQPLSAMQRDRWGADTVTPTGRASTEALDKVLADSKPTLIIIDGTTSLYRIHGQDTNAAGGTDLIGGWLRRLTDNGRRTVLLIDHTGKSASPGSTPMGSQHKIAMIQGTALHVYAVTKPRRGTKTTAALFVGKDRPGEVARHALEVDALRAADVVFDSTGPALLITLTAPSTGTFVLDASASELGVLAASIEDHYPSWLSRDEAVLAADLTHLSEKVQRSRLDVLLAKGVIEERGVGRARLYRHVPSINLARAVDYRPTMDPVLAAIDASGAEGITSADLTTLLGTQSNNLTSDPTFRMMKEASVIEDNGRATSAKRWHRGRAAPAPWPW